MQAVQGARGVRDDGSHTEGNGRLAAPPSRFVRSHHRGDERCGLHAAALSRRARRHGGASVTPRTAVRNHGSGSRLDERRQLGVCLGDTLERRDVLCRVRATECTAERAARLACCLGHRTRAHLCTPLGAVLLAFERGEHLLGGPRGSAERVVASTCQPAVEGGSQIGSKSEGSQAWASGGSHMGTSVSTRMAPQMAAQMHQKPRRRAHTATHRYAEGRAGALP